MGTTEKFAAGFSDRMVAVGAAEQQREAAAANEKYYWANIESLAVDPLALDETQRRRFDKFCRDVGKLPDQVRDDIAAVKRAREAQPVIDRAEAIRRQLGAAEHAVLHPPVLSPQMARLCLPGYLRARRGELQLAEEQAAELVQAQAAVDDLVRRQVML